MKSSHHAESTQSASGHYAPSVPMSVYRELATELRANKAVIDSLNSRNQQLMEQNQRLRQEIHNVVQATLSLGQFAGVARKANPDGFPNAIAPDTLSRLVNAQRETQNDAQPQPPQNAQAVQPEVNAPVQEAPDLVREIAQAAAMQSAARRSQPSVVMPSQPSAPPRARSPRPIQHTPQNTPQDRAQSERPTEKRRVKAKSPKRDDSREALPKRKSAQKPKAVKAPKAVQPSKKAELAAIANTPSTQAFSKLFTEQSGEYRSSVMESSEEKEIGGIWLALSIVLIIVTAFGAGFLIMKPLLNDR